MSGDRSPVLEARAVSKHFAGVAALREVSFAVRAGEVHALCGENGAGKSTLIKLLSGVHAHGSYAGEVALSGAPVRFSSTRDAEQAGIAVIHQELALVPELSVAENLSLSDLPRRHGLLDWDALFDRARVALTAVGLAIDPRTRTSELGVGQRQLVEIARALARNPRVLVLDEPTAALGEREAAALLERVRELRARDVACIYISHKLDEVFAVADRITVLRDGQSVVTLDPTETEPDAVIGHMVGRPLAELFPRRNTTPGETVLHVQDLHVARAPGEPGRLHGIDLSVRAGEIVGIGGLLGAGRSELLLHLFGAYGVRVKGRVDLRGRSLPTEPSAALRAGVALVSEDRRRHGVFLDEGLAFNLTLSSLWRTRGGLLLDRERESLDAQRWLDRLGVKASLDSARAGGLSGGNQQKLVLGKALMTEPVLLLLDEPTRGIDVGAKRELWDLINALAEQGKAVLLVSSELPELIAMSDRIAMLCEGRIGGVFERGQATPERLLAAALGRSAARSSTVQP